MKEIKFEVLTRTGAKQVVCKLKETVKDGFRRQSTKIWIDGQSVGNYARIRHEHGSTWWPWVDSSFSHKARSIRQVVDFWTN